MFETRKEVLSDQESSWSSGNSVTNSLGWKICFLLHGHIACVRSCVFKLRQTNSYCWWQNKICQKVWYLFHDLGSWFTLEVVCHKVEKEWIWRMGSNYFSSMRELFCRMSEWNVFWVELSKWVTLCMLQYRLAAVQPHKFTVHRSITNQTSSRITSHFWFQSRTNKIQFLWRTFYIWDFLLGKIAK